MNKIAVVTDSDANISLQEAKELGIYIFSKPLSCGEKIIIDGVDCTYDEFLEELRKGNNYKSSQMAPLVMTEMFDNLLKTYDNIIYIPISSNMSKAYETGVLMEQDYNGKLKTIDARSVASFEGYEVHLAKQLIDEGRSFKEITDILEKRGGSARAWVIPETLTYLKRGGRISPAAAALGGLLGIKPILLLKNGAIDKCGTARTLKKAYQYAIEELLKDNPQPETHQLYLLHTNEPEMVKEVMELIKSYEPLKAFDVRVETVPCVVLCHTGPKTIAIGYSKKFVE